MSGEEGVTPLQGVARRNRLEIPPTTTVTLEVSEPSELSKLSTILKISVRINVDLTSLIISSVLHQRKNEKRFVLLQVCLQSFYFYVLSVHENNLEILHNIHTVVPLINITYEFHFQWVSNISRTSVTDVEENGDDPHLSYSMTRPRVNCEQS